MQKYMLLWLSLFLYDFSNAQTTVTKDSAIQISKAQITIKANSFQATTIVELELFNPNNKILDGEVNFSLADGQVVNDFKLDINGHLRDGVIIEKQKARVAYENVIRRKVDPGLLEATASNQYRIRVYPMPANGTRRLSFTVQQLLTPNHQQTDYLFPLTLSCKIEKLHVNALVRSEEIPFVSTGLLKPYKFLSTTGNHNLQAEPFASQPNILLSFSIPITQKNTLCLFESDCEKGFMGRIIPDSFSLPKRTVNAVTVFWDVSLSAEKRSIPKEIAFLEGYLNTYKPQQLTVVTFAIDAVETKTFFSPAKNISSLRQFLESQAFDGGTKLSSLRCNSFPADEYLLFSDGHNTFGEGGIVLSDRPWFCIQSSVSANTKMLNRMATATAGKRIDLLVQTSDEAIANLQQPEWNLQVSQEQKDSLQLEWIKLGNGFVFSGISKPGVDTFSLELEYAGEKRGIKFLLKNATCNNQELSDAAAVLSQQVARTGAVSQDSLLAGAITQHVVTESTSLIVLDALEDYYQYQIMPPKELEEEFKKRYPSLPDKQEEKQKEKEILVYQKLTQTLVEYNEKRRWWDPKLTALTLSPYEEKAKAVIVSSDKPSPVIPDANNLLAFKSSTSLNEVVVVGYGTQRRRDLTGAVTSIGSNQLQRSTTVQSALEGRVVGLSVNGNPGSSATIQLRGIASLRGDGEPLYIVDGVRTNAADATSMSTFNIESISVLKDAASVSIYGAGAANGVVVITTKRGQITHRSTPEDEEGLSEEELLDTLKEMGSRIRYADYLQLKTSWTDAPWFYFAAAGYFHQQHKEKEALRILSNLAEIKAEDHQALRTLGYVLEEWNDYANAIEIYKKVLVIKEEEPQSYRDLALAYAMSGNRSEAVRLLYAVLQKDWGAYEGRYQGLREIMLNEFSVLLNTKDTSDFGVNKDIVQALPVDLRVVVDWNKDETDIDLHVIEPGGEEYYYSHRQTKSGGRITKDFTQGYGPEEYEVKTAMKGTYKIKIDYYGDRYQKQRVPSFVKLTVFKNYGKPNQTITLKTVKLDGGERMIDLATVKF